MIICTAFMYFRYSWIKPYQICFDEIANGRAGIAKYKTFNSLCGCRHKFPWHWTNHLCVLLWIVVYSAFCPNTSLHRLMDCFIPGQWLGCRGLLGSGMNGWYGWANQGFHTISNFISDIYFQRRFKTVVPPQRFFKTNIWPMENIAISYVIKSKW